MDPGTAPSEPSESAAANRRLFMGGKPITAALESNKSHRNGSTEGKTAAVLNLICPAHWDRATAHAAMYTSVVAFWVGVITGWNLSARSRRALSVDTAAVADVAGTRGVGKGVSAVAALCVAFALQRWRRSMQR